MPIITYSIDDEIKLADTTLPPIHHHPQKNKLYHLARYSLAKCLSINEKKYIKPSLDLTFDFNSIKQYPSYKCSLSHSLHKAAACCSNDPDIMALGIDLELKSRKMPIGGEHHYINDEDNLAQYSPLEVWCIKEACFKAITGVWPECKLLKEVIIKDEQFYFKNPSSWTQKFKIFQQDETLLVIAYIQKDSSTPEFIYCEKEL